MSATAVRSVLGLFAMNSFSRRAFLAAAGAATAGAVSSRQRALAEPVAGKLARIRIGQIGTAHAHAEGKIEAMRASPEFEVAGVVEPDPARRAAAEKSKAYQGLSWLTEEQLLNVEGLQVVAIETEIKNLLSTAARCIAAGKHIHLDKPAGESLPEFRELLGNAARQSLTVQMGYMFRYNPAFQLCFQLVRDGFLGDVFAIDTAMSKAVEMNERRRVAPYPGGSMFELGGHIIDAVVTVLGKPTRVTPYNRSASPLRDGFSDNQLAVLEYPGATVAVRSAMVEIGGVSRRQFVVCGTGGTLDIHPLEPAHARLALAAPRGEYKAGYQDVSLPPTRGRYEGDFADLGRVIRGESEFGFSAGHDLAVQETLLLASGLPIS